MGAYYPSLTSPKNIPSSPYLRSQEVASLQSSDLPDNTIYLNQPSPAALHPQLLSGSSFSACNFVEDHSVGSRNAMSLIPQIGHPASTQPIGGQLISPALSDGNTAMLDPQIFSQKMYDAKNEGLLFQGLSLSLETQIPSSVQMSSYQNHYTNPCQSSLMSSCLVNAEDQGSRNSISKNAEYLSFDLAGGTWNIANIGAMRNHQFSINSKEVNPASHWHEPAGFSGNIYNSKYFKAAQDLLDEVVNIRGALTQSMKRQKFNSLGENISKETDLKFNSHSKLSSTNMFSDPHDSATKPPSELSPSECHDLHSKMTKLLSMLEEVDRRYRQYYEQIQVLASSFEMVAGSGAASLYTGLALQTISCQFRRLHDTIKRQIQVTQHCLGEEGETANSQGGELPRLRYIDQKLRQQRALQQFGIVRQPWRPQKGLPETAVSILRAWLFEHFLNPYPKDSEKIMLAKQTGLTRNQVANWFINARVRLWKPMIEEMYKEEFGDTQAESQNSPEHEQIAVTETSRSENKLDSVQKRSTCAASGNDNKESGSEDIPDADMNACPMRLNFKNGTQEVDVSNHGLVKLHGGQKLNIADHPFGPDEITSTNWNGDGSSITATSSNDISLLDHTVGNQVSLALGLQQGEKEYQPVSIGTRLKDKDTVTSSPGLTEAEYYYMPLNQQGRFANQHLLSDFIL